ncbi:tetratricopeptide repeat protein [Wukongibacter sp. M2B1]|uniref:tetratricopeptide repeat protein n=1 Tax=Wukongibacter sp. M2B1 TaxID=3088895 RepID=UPI003D7A40AC
MKDILKKAIELREHGKVKEANSILVELAKNFPDNAEVNYQCAWSFDVLGLEKEAVPFYEKSIELGLPEKDMKEAYLGLGMVNVSKGSFAKHERNILELSILVIANVVITNFTWSNMVDGLMMT